MRNFSKDNQNNYRKEHTMQRTLTGQKIITNCLKEDEVRVGKYKYNMSQELGHGYSSKVYKGVQIHRPNIRYAIKVINLQKFKGSSMELLQTQINIHRCLNHQNIVKLHETIKTSQYYYLILEYCPHGNLSQYIAQKKRLTESNALDVISQILNGYKYLLREDIIHRDIKPANILRVGNKWKISDFGFAVKSKFAFKDRNGLGTPLYMAPQSIKRSFYSYKSDLYSLGIVFYQMVIGVTPHEAKSRQQLLELINHDIQVPESVNHPKLIELISKLCQINESKRMSRQMIQNYDLNISKLSRVGEKSMHTSKLSLHQSKNSLTTNDSMDRKYGSIKSANKNKEPQNNIKLKKQQNNRTKSAQQDKYVHKNQTLLNKQILLEQLNYIHFLYNNIKNIQAFLLQETSKRLLELTLFKLLLKIMKSLCNKEKNLYGIEKWSEFINTKIYQDIFLSFTNQSEKYQKQYLQFIKYNDIKIIRMVNRRFPQLSQQSTLNSKFYENLRNFMAEIIKQHIQGVKKMINNNQQQLNDCFQALKNLWLILKICQVRKKGQLGYDKKPQTQMSFRQSKLDMQDFYKLQREIKNYCELQILSNLKL